MQKAFFLALLMLVAIAPAHAQPEPLTFGVEPNFDKAGAQIVYASLERGVRDIFVVDEAGNRDSITSDIYWDGQPAFAPDASIVYVSDRSGSRELWQAGPNFENPVQLTDGGGWKASPSVSQSGDIVFTSGRHPKTDIYVLKEGRNAERLTYFEDEIYSPVWSPDGGKIAFVMGGDLMVINTDGSDLKTLVKSVYTRGLSWNNKNKIFYLSKGIGYDLWSVGTISGDRKLIYEGVTDSWEINPTLSSKGDLAFSTDKDGFYTIYIEKIPLPVVRASESAEPAIASLPMPLPTESMVASPEPAPEKNEERIRDRSEDQNKNLKEELENHETSKENNELEIPENPVRESNDLVIPENPSFGHEDIIPDNLFKESAQTPVDDTHVWLWVFSVLGLVAFYIEKQKNKRDLQLIS